MTPARDAEPGVINGAGFTAGRAPRRHLPISFSDPLIPRVLDGTKTQTRRVIAAEGAQAPHIAYWRPANEPQNKGRWVASDGLPIGHIACPYGQPGDLLWVREGLVRGVDGLVHYAADGALVFRHGGPVRWTWKPKRLPSRYCPRWASRIDLENAAVDVQRVGNISEEDARAEGVKAAPLPSVWARLRYPPTARDEFRSLWDSINGKRPGCAWADSPWCWAVSFRVVRP